MKNKLYLLMCILCINAILIVVAAAAMPLKKTQKDNTVKYTMQHLDSSINGLGNLIKTLSRPDSSGSKHGYKCQ